jgi:hypothetical protein
MNNKIIIRRSKRSKSKRSKSKRRSKRILRKVKEYDGQMKKGLYNILYEEKEEARKKAEKEEARKKAEEEEEIKKEEDIKKE